MATLHQILMIGWVAGFALMIGFGLVAWAHADPEKKGGGYGNRSSWGPMISEYFLTERGLKWALARNFATLFFAVCSFSDAVVFSMMRK
jgi:hypothetical protein